MEVFRRSRRRPRVTMQSVAERAGVSLATVDRILNNRGIVQPNTRDHVLGVAVSLGYLAPTSHVPPALSAVTFDVVLPGGTNGFLNLLANEIMREADAQAPMAVNVRLHRVEGFDPDALASCLDRIEASHGVGVIALDHPQVRDAMRSLRGRGVPIATLVSDMSEIDSLGYVGIDNRASGRLAAHLLGRLVGPRSGTVLLFLGSRSYRGHEEREIGFRHVLEDEFGALSVVPVRDMRDNNDATRAETARLLHGHPDTVGIYNIAGGNRGIASALAEADRNAKPVFVAHELTPSSRPLVTSGLIDVVIDQDAAQEARELLRMLVEGAKGGRPVARRIRITPFFRENLP